jgi:hypothetical protein
MSAFLNSLLGAIIFSPVWQISHITTIFVGLRISDQASYTYKINTVIIFYTRAIQNVTSSELLTKQVMMGKMYKHTYILKYPHHLILKYVFITKIVALVLGNEFCMPVSKKSATYEL